MKSLANFFWIAALGAAIVFSMAGCASAPAETGTVALTVNPGPNQSVIVIQRQSQMAGAIIPMDVWVDGEKVGPSIPNGGTAQIIIPNGEHSIHAGSSNADRGKEIKFSVNGEAIFFSAKPQMGILSARFSLTQTGKRRL